MDYERLYKEAIERARKIHNDTEFDYEKGMMEEIIPELKESEDEKIRKRILLSLQKDFMATKNSGCSTKDLEECIAWLEKQGEQKEYTFKSIPRLLDMIQPTDRAKSYCQKLIDSLLQEGYATDAKIVGDCLKQMKGEKVGMATMDEQKPQGKSALEAIQEIEVDNANKVVPKDYNSVDPHFAKPIDKVEPNSTWSEEDAFRTSTLTDIVKSGGSIRAELRNEFIDWLKSLKDRIQY